MDVPFVLLFLLTFFNFNRQILSFPNGPGWHSCHNLQPDTNSHRLKQTSESPYEIVLSASAYTANTPKLNVTLQKKPNKVGFKGFLVTAYDDKGQSVGTFLDGPQNQLLCDYDAYTAHKNNDIKDAVTFEWIPPISPVGNIVFKATIVQSQVIYWQNIPSETLTGPGQAVDQKPPNPVNTGTPISSLDFNECGKTRGCLRVPSSCTSESNCLAIVSWKDANDYIEFDISVNGSYRAASFGFSKDNLMSDDSIFGCYVKDNFEKFNASNYYSPKNLNNHPLSKFVVKKPIDKAIVLDGASFNAVERLKCKIRRKKYVTGEEEEYFDIRNQSSYYLMLALSDFSVNLPRYDGLYYHYAAKVITKSLVSVTTDQDIKLDLGNTVATPPPTTTPGSGQLSIPADCEEPKCEGVVAWKDMGDEVAFVLRAATGFGYVGFGLSHDKKMHEDSMIICSTLDTTPKAVNYYSNTEKGTPTLIGEDGIKLKESSSADGIECKFFRKKMVNNLKIYDISPENSYYVFLAFGRVENDALQYHTKRVSTSTKITLLESAEVTKPVSTIKPTSGPSKINFDECGIKKSCFRTPANCDPESKCNFVATWKKVANSYEFEISGSASFQYVAFGLSKDKKMGDDSVIACTKDGVTNFYTEGRDAKPIGDQGLTTLEIKNENGIFCKFKREINVNNEKIYDTVNGAKFTILLAGGSVSSRKSGDLTYHGENKVVSDKEVSLNDIVNLGGKTKSQNLMKTHGILMSFAWIIFAVFGIFNARYFKTLYMNQICGKDTWFILHVMGMIMATFTTIAAFIIIVYDLDGKIVDNANKLHDAHPIVGIVVLILVLINPIMAAFRPSPGASKRPIFNWAHRIVGLSALILGIVNVVIGLRLDRVGLVEDDLWVSWVAVGFFFFSIFIGLVLDFVPLCGTDAQIRKSNEYALEPVGQSSKTKKESYNMGRFVKGFCLVLIVLASLALMIIILIKVSEK